MLLSMACARENCFLSPQVHCGRGRPTRSISISSTLILLVSYLSKKWRVSLTPLPLPPLPGLHVFFSQAVDWCRSQMRNTKRRATSVSRELNHRACHNTPNIYLYICIYIYICFYIFILYVYMLYIFTYLHIYIFIYIFLYLYTLGVYIYVFIYLYL